MRAYQLALVTHGYLTNGGVDGAYGPGTRAALRTCLAAGCRLTGERTIRARIFPPSYEVWSVFGPDA